MNIAEFLGARLGEDEAMAACNTGDRGLSDNGGDTTPGWPDYQTYDGADLDAAYDYITRFRPVRMLREVEAKRRILAEHAPDEEGHCQRCITNRIGYEEQWACDAWPCRTLRLLAEVYSDHPDYSLINVP